MLPALFLFQGQGRNDARDSTILARDIRIASIAMMVLVWPFMSVPGPGSGIGSV